LRQKFLQTPFLRRCDGNRTRDNYHRTSRGGPNDPEQCITPNHAKKKGDIHLFFAFPDLGLPGSLARLHPVRPYGTAKTPRPVPNPLRRLRHDRLARVGAVEPGGFQVGAVEIGIGLVDRPGAAGRRAVVVYVRPGNVGTGSA
jgi:hypothetical protein